MNNKRPYKVPAGFTNPEYLYDVSVNGRRLRKGMQVSVPQGLGRFRAGRYRFDYAERPNGVLLIHATGPVSQKPEKWRNVVLREEHIKTVHTKTGGARDA